MLECVGINMETSNKIPQIQVTVGALMQYSKVKRNRVCVKT
jgi:hypothetical protein